MASRQYRAKSHKSALGCQNVISETTATSGCGGFFDLYPFIDKEENKMKCPACNIDLIIADRQGVEIDYCPQCRGVWLDRGELDKIIDRSASWTRREERYDPGDTLRRDDDDYPRRYDGDDYRKKRRKSFLGELFDFD
jgi:Zn-finger nucleic acid-binding protein